MVFKPNVFVMFMILLVAGLIFYYHSLPKSEEPLSIIGSCNTVADCPSSHCLYDSKTNTYTKFSDPRCFQSVGSNFCSYETIQKGFPTSSCTSTAVQTCTVKYCCGTPSSSGVCPSGTYSNIYKVNSDCSYTWIAYCSQGSCAHGSSTCPINSGGSSTPLPTQYKGSITLK